MQLISGKNKEIAKEEWHGDWMSAKFNKLGDVQLLIDTTPPTITPVGWKNNAVSGTAKNLVLRSKDNLDAIHSFRAELDGKWLMFARKGDNFIYTFDEHCSKGKHNLKVMVMDVAGNITEQNFTFTR